MKKLIALFAVIFVSGVLFAYDNPAILDLSGDTAKKIPSCSESLVCEKWNIFVDICDDYIDVAIDQSFKNTGKGAIFNLGYLNEYPWLEGRKGNTEAILLDSKRVEPKPYFAETNGEGLWNVISVYLKKNQTVNLKTQNHIVNCIDGTGGYCFGFEEYFCLNFGDWNYSVPKEIICTVKNSTIDRVLYHIDSFEGVPAINWISDDTFEMGFPTKALFYEFLMHHFNPEQEQDYMNYMKEADYDAVFLRDVFNWKKEFLLEKYANSEYEGIIFQTKKQLRFFRNAIYALHGKRFNDTSLQNYFSSLLCYKVNPNFSESDLSKDEQDVVKRLIEIESSRKYKKE